MVHKKEFYDNEVAETLEWVAQGSSGGPIPGNIQGQVGWASEQPDLVKNVPVHSMWVELDEL